VNFAFKFEVHTTIVSLQKQKPFNRQTVISVNQLFKVHGHMPSALAGHIALILSLVFSISLGAANML